MLGQQTKGSLVGDAPAKDDFMADAQDTGSSRAGPGSASFHERPMDEKQEFIADNASRPTRLLPARVGLACFGNMLARSLLVPANDVLEAPEEPLKLSEAERVWVTIWRGH